LLFLCRDWNDFIVKQVICATRLREFVHVCHGIYIEGSRDNRSDELELYATMETGLSRERDPRGSFDGGEKG
jgi:hypothetical protein